jgi:hypothetical protein
MKFVLKYVWGLLISLMSMSVVLLYGLSWLLLVIVMVVAVVFMALAELFKWLILCIYDYFGPKCKPGEDLRNPLSKFTKWFLTKTKVDL